MAGQQVAARPNIEKYKPSKGKYKRKTGPFAFSFTFHPYFSAMELHQVLGQGQAQSGSLICSVGGAISLLKRMKNFPYIFIADTDAVVRYGEFNALLSVVSV